MNKLNVLPVIYKFSDKELEQLLSSIVILIDTREQRIEHITQYFIDKGISYKNMQLETGDYSVMLPAIPDLGIHRDLYFPIFIERKNGNDELALSIKDRTRFAHELSRSEKYKFILMVEDTFENLVLGNYQSKYNPKALLASLKTFEARHGFTTVFVQKRFAGNYVFHTLYYHVRECLK